MLKETSTKIITAPERNWTFFVTFFRSVAAERVIKSPLGHWFENKQISNAVEKAAHQYSGRPAVKEHDCQRGGAYISPYHGSAHDMIALGNNMYVCITVYT